jgi:hypothetical protein
MFDIVHRLGKGALVFVYKRICCPDRSSARGSAAIR